MTVPAEHRGRFVYHSTHLENLEGVVRHGILSYNEQRQVGIEHHSIAAQSIQDRRARMPVTTGPGGVVHDYVPLYFTKLSPMLLQVVQAKNVDQILLLHFAFPISLVERQDVVFTDAAANSTTPPNFYSDPSDLGNLLWDAIDLRKWKSLIDGQDVKHERMAEVLVHRHLDPADAIFVVVWNDWVKKEVEKIYAQASATPPTLRFGGYDESHTFTHFRKELPSDMLNTSIASGPIWTKHCFDEVVSELDSASSTRPQPRFSSLKKLLVALRKTGLAVLPETSELIDLESENEAHTHDVGTHTLRVVEKLTSSDRFVDLAQRDQRLVELAAYLHDIGKGPKSRWSKCGDKQQLDADHPIRSMQMLPRILSEEIHLAPAGARRLCKLVCYHDLVGDILGKGRNAEQLEEIAETERDLDMLVALGLADMCAVSSFWDSIYSGQVQQLRDSVLAKLNEDDEDEEDC